MIVDNKLVVLETFDIDRTLPKHAKANAQAEQSTGFVVMSEEDSGRMMMRSPGVYRTSATGMSTEIIVRSNRNPNLSWFMRAVYWFARLFARRPEPEPVTMPVEQFFASVKNTTKELEVIGERAAGYSRAIAAARSAGQKALLEQLTDGLEAYRMETQLLAIGMKKYVEESTVVEFYKKSEKGLRLDWVSNFTRPIPADVLERKVRADDIGIFDNYVVLHYDPQAKSYAQTQEEKEAARRPLDPILFGLIKGSRKLYCVGDWVDQYCDLTLDQIADALGASAVKNIGEV